MYVFKPILNIIETHRFTHIYQIYTESINMSLGQYGFFIEVNFENKHYPLIMT